MVAGLILSFSSVQAEEENSNTSGSSRNSELKELRDEKLAELKESREAFREKIQTERKTFSDELKKNREAFLLELKTKKDEFKNVRTEAKRDFCEKAKDMLSNRFGVAVTQLERFQTKVGELITKLDAEGKDTTVAKESLALSKQKLADAKAKLSEIKALVPEGCENITPEVFEQVKLGARVAKDLLKESKRSLQQALKEVMSLRGEDKDENEGN